MVILITVQGNGLALLEEATRSLGSEAKARRAFTRAINRTGQTVGNEAGRALADQTGLPRRTGIKAVRRDVERATPATLSYTINGQGGDISLRYFKPRETRKGVTANPWNKRTLYPSTFMKAGWWPKRVVKSNWNGQVFARNGDGHSYDGLKSKGAKRVGTKFTKQKSGLFIPIEMVQGATAAAWQQGARRLQPRIEHEVRHLTRGVVS
ncbi:hypothetical protein J2Y63_003781 [Shinella sp. BE166]